MNVVTRDNLRNHDLLVVRSRALHRAVADKIRADPELMVVAQENLVRWISEEQEYERVTPGMLEWKQIFDTHTVEEILDLLCEASEQADRLRHATPFCGILAEQEHAAIYQHYAAFPA